ncbi:tetratricopeptide repeat protein [Aureimonas populi]|uniref:Tetratricopeptide repeat protein n=1 Tax=Aureimonas populi TaxID=1701758 RepID=A0ABW5CJT0_9HYPH|nr:tetratricopeptide repeat protein [Aureimonas populi]
MRWLERSRRAEPDPMHQALTAARAGDYAAALAIWEPLARSGHARAQNNIGACFAEGLGVAADPMLAFKWLKLSVDGGDPVGRRNLAALYFRGEGVPQDDIEAMRLYRLAAEEGDGPAQDMLSWMLLEGEAPDLAEVKRWAELAAGQGVAASMTRLGMLHHNALGVPRDPAEAARWWRMAAEAGDADGQAMLGAAYLTGGGVARDPLAALEWLLRGRAGGSALAQNFVEPARAQLSEGEQAEARRRARLPLAQEGPAA